jgi:hypothetical protein
MKYLSNRKSAEFLKAEIVGANLFFNYSEETPRSYQKYNAFIQGMDWIKSTATIRTTSKLALNIDDKTKIRLENGLEFKIASITPVTSKRRAMYQADNVTAYIINLE